MNASIKITIETTRGSDKYESPHTEEIALEGPREILCAILEDYTVRGKLGELLTAPFKDGSKAEAS